MIHVATWERKAADTEELGITRDNPVKAEDAEELGLMWIEYLVGKAANVEKLGLTRHNLAGNVSADYSKCAVDDLILCTGTSHDQLILREPCCQGSVCNGYCHQDCGFGCIFDLQQHHIRIAHSVRTQQKIYRNLYKVQQKVCSKI